ncbi:MAG: sulfatase-like hydrolase/transferase [Polyangiaceae bacterium]|nr:sulfatase-like hydrolase/transferase [Polyangiaceae bacterium]
MSTPTSFRRTQFGLGLVLGLAIACDERKPPPSPEHDAALPVVEAPTPRRSEQFDLVEQLALCEIRHRGLSLDFGTRAAERQRAFQIPPFEDLENAERDGATVTRVLGRRLNVDLWLDTPVDDPYLELRVHGRGARRMTVNLGERRAGSVRLNPGETKIHRLPALRGELAPGRHPVQILFSGRTGGALVPQAELDWLRLGVEDDSSATYAAPTLKDVVSDVVIDGVPKRSIVLRAPGAVRCPVVLAPDARLHVALGFWGAGTGTAALRVVSDGAEPTTLLERKLTGGSGATWTTVERELEAHANKTVMVELRAIDATQGGRVAFGDPIVARQAAPVASPQATTVVVVVLSSIDRRRTPPWGPRENLAALPRLIRGGVAFSGYRAPTTVPGAVVASMLTGLPPRAHALEDPAARIPSGVRLISEIVKQSSGRTAFFTGVPTTFRAFGFDAGWDEFEELSPVRDLAGSEPIRRASRWLEQELGAERAPRRFVVVHARGNHPPWDLTREEVSRLPPEEYGGLIDARRGGIILARLRNRRNKAQRRLDEPDWVRLRALEQVALQKQDDALGELLATLQKKGEWDRTLLIVVGDVAPGEGPEPPYDPAAPIAEERLYVPLIVRFPAGALADTETQADVTSVDIAETVLSALGLSPPVALRGHDLFAMASGSSPLVGRPLLVTLGDRFATRHGGFRLAGEFGKRPSLCQLDVDPACVNDVFDRLPIAAQALWTWTFEAETRALAARVAPREPASIDPDTGAALTVWGDI